MFLPSRLLSLSLLASIVFVRANHCTLCYGTEESMAIPLPDAQALEDGTTCNKLGKISQFKGEREDVCLEYYQFLGFSKCGCEAPTEDTVKPTCGLCHDHSLPTAPEATFDSSTDTTCQEAYNYLRRFEQSDETCRSFQHLGVTNCGCPHTLPAITECAFCNENEQLQNPNDVIGGDGTTCGLMEYLLAVDWEGTYANQEICDTAKQGFREKCTCVAAPPTTSYPTSSPTTSLPTPSPTPSLEEICDDINGGNEPFIPESAQSDVGGYELNVMMATDASVGILLPVFEKEMTKVISTDARGCQSRRLHVDNDEGSESAPIIHFADFFDLKEKENASCSSNDIKGTRCYVVQGNYKVFYSPAESKNKNNPERERRLGELSITEQILVLLEQTIQEKEIQIQGIEGVVYQPINDTNFNKGESDQGKGNGINVGGSGTTIGVSVGASVVVALLALVYRSKTKVKSLSKSRRPRASSSSAPTSEKELIYHSEVYMRSDDSISNSPSTFDCGPNGTTIDYLNPILLVDDDNRSDSDSEMPFDERENVEVVCTDSVYSASTREFEGLYSTV